MQNLLNKQLKFLPKRKIASTSLRKFGLAILVSNLGEAVVINKDYTKGILLRGYLAKDF